MKKTIEVTQRIEIEFDEKAFNEEFFTEFRESFYPFYYLNEHLQHLAQMYARGLIDGFPKEFVEGYGLINEFGLKFELVDQWEDVI